MATYLGLDIGTSAVKAVLVDEAQEVRAEASSPLAISRPRELWSEQQPNAWWATPGGRGRGLALTGRVNRTRNLVCAGA